MTPHAYVTARRVAVGKTLLARGLPVADAALAVGFFDQSHFANRFRETASVLGLDVVTGRKCSDRNRFGPARITCAGNF